MPVDTALHSQQFYLRIKEIRAWLLAKKLDGFLISIPEIPGYENTNAAQYLSWLTGFSGSRATAIVLLDLAVIFVDGRYLLQANKQVNTEIFVIDHITSLSSWISKTIKSKQRLGFDPWLHTINDIEVLQEALIEVGAELIEIKKNPIEENYASIFRLPCAYVEPHPMHFCGESTTKKLQRLVQEIEKRKATSLIVTDPCSLAWLFNIRAPENPYTPVLPGMAIVKKETKPLLFIDKEKLSPNAENYLDTLADIQPLKGSEREILKCIQTDHTILIDPTSTPEKLHRILKGTQAKILLQKDPILLLKAIKNSIEQEGAKAAHQRDALAIISFLCWLDSQEIGHVNEISASEKLSEFRKKVAEKTQASFKGNSFKTISALGENGAIIHYHPSPKTNRFSCKHDIYLLDSGAQYCDGTTDVTRSILIGSGPVDKERQYHFTLVLKGLIALSNIRFPKGTRGCDVDILARQFLWMNGLDYPHGTGHGVGSFLSVHEGPQTISKNGTEELQTGMIVSNEPGYYKPGHYGIRCENLMLVTPLENLTKGEKPMHGFETLTLVPFDKKLIDFSLLTKQEDLWLRQYHERIYTTLAPLLEPAVLQWLSKAIA